MEKEDNYMMKRSQTKKISAMLAAALFLWGGGTLFFGGDSVSAAEIQGEERKAALTKILDSLKTDTTNKLSDDEKAWFVNTFSTFRYDSNVSGMALTPGGANGDDNLVVGGNDNYRYAKTKNSVVIGNNNRAVGYFGTAVGEANKVMGRNGVAIGARNTAGNFRNPAFSNAVAIGWDNFVNGTSTGIGLKTVSTGDDAIAIGSQAVAGTDRAWDFFFNEIDYDKQPYYQQLQTQYPDLFGAYDSTEEGLNKVRQNIFDKYIGLFYTYGINSLDDLTRESAASHDSILTALGWQYALTRDNVSAPVAIGRWSKALSDNSVALGAYSAVTKADMDETTGTLSKPALFSGITLRQSGNLGSDGNANGEYLTGAISIGGPRYVDKLINLRLEVVQEGNYVRQIKHLADGTDPTDAVNLRQLRGALFNGIKAGDGVTITKQDDPTKPDYGTITVTAANTNTGNAATYSFEGGDNVTVTSEEKDGVTHVTISAKDTTYTAGENVTIDKDGKISAKDTTYTAGENVTIDKDRKISAKDTTYTAGENVTIDKDGKISAKDTTYTAGDNVTIDKDGKISAKDTTYTAGENVTIDKDGKISAKDTTYTAGDNVTIDKDGKISAKDTTYTAGENVTIDKDRKISAKDTTYTAGSNLMLSDKNKFSLAPKLTNIESIKGKDNTKGELKFTAEGVELSHQTNSLRVGNKIKATAGSNTLVLGDAIEAKSGNNSLSVGNTIQATVGTNSLTVGDTIEAKAGKNLFALSDNDLKVTVGTTDTGSTAMSQTTDTVAWTVTGKAADGKSAPTTTVSITAEGLDVGKTRIHNLADGKALTDAATVGQLTIAKKEFNTHFTKLDGDVTKLDKRVTTVEGDVVNLQNSMNGMNTRITKLDRRVDKVGAGAAALAALHPLDFDPDNKWDIAGGYGHYAGQSAMALGAYYRPNEDVMFSIGGAFGNGEDMINAGVSVKVGSGESKTTTSKAAMAKEIKELRGIVVAQQASMEKQEARIQELEKMIQKLVK